MQLGFDPDNEKNKMKKEKTRGKTSSIQNEKSDDFSFDSDEELDENNKKKKLENSKLLLYVAIVVIVLAIIIAIVVFVGQSQNEPVVTDSDLQDSVTNSNTASDGDLDSDDESFVYDEDGNPIYSSDNYVVNDKSIDPGAPDYADSLRKETTSTVYSDTDFIKDINNVDIAANYKVESRDYVNDYVSYVAKRGIIDDGMEIYWLECTYHDKKYRCQVPFYYFKDFQETGICKVEMEVLNIEGGGKVISYMQVVGND